MTIESQIKIGKIAVSRLLFWDNDLQRSIPLQGEIYNIDRLDRIAYITFGGVDTSIRFEDIERIDEA